MKHRVWKGIFCMIIVASILTCQIFAVSTSALSCILIEQESGRVLYEKDAHSRHLIASITKIMTAVVALERGDLRQCYTVTWEDMAEGSSMYLKPGEEITLEALVYGLMLSSGNDAALAVARCVSGTVEDFVALMNATAESLGMTDTHFENPNGLDGEEHYSSAADMAVLTAYALENRDFARIVSTDSITLGERYLQNHNKLLKSLDGCIGVKTGYTRAAGRTLVSAVRREGMTLICVTLNDGDDWKDHSALMEFGFGEFTRQRAAAKGAKVASVPVRGGTSPVVPLILAEDLAYPLKTGEKLTVKLSLPVMVQAPVVPGQTVGTARLFLDGEEVAAVELLAGAHAAKAAEESAAPNLWQRLRGN